MYNKLFAKILVSSIWLEPYPTRIVWTTLLASMDEEGMVTAATVENLAGLARVTIDECIEAVKKFEKPDKNSSDPENKGRRIERVPGGWLVLNAVKYRNLVTRAIAQEGSRERVRKFRERKKAEKLAAANVTASNGLVTASNGLVTSSEAVSETESRREVTPPSPSSLPPAPAQPLRPATATTQANGQVDKPLSRKAKGNESIAVKLAVQSGDLLGLIQAFGAKVGENRDFEWKRDCEGATFGTIALVFAWRRHQRIPIREPSGWRNAYATWRELDRNTHLHFAALLLPEYGLMLPDELNKTAAVPV